MAPVIEVLEVTEYKKSGFRSFGFTFKKNNFPEE